MKTKTDGVNSNNANETIPDKTIEGKNIRHGERSTKRRSSRTIHAESGRRRDIIKNGGTKETYGLERIRDQ